MTDRARLINQGRGFLMERGLLVGTGRHVFQKELTRLTTEGGDDLSPRIFQMLADMTSELDEINRRVTALDIEIRHLARTDADMLRLTEISGVGPPIAAALVAAIGTGSSFAKGRDLPAWLGRDLLQLRGLILQRLQPTHLVAQRPPDPRHRALAACGLARWQDHTNGAFPS